MPPRRAAGVVPIKGLDALYHFLCYNLCPTHVTDCALPPAETI